MPTYRNDSTETKTIQNISGSWVNVTPTQTVQTYDFLGAGWTETSASPVYNPILSTQTVTLAPEGVTVNFDHNLMGYFVITNITDNITAVFNEAVTNTPALFENWPSTAASSPRYNNDNRRCRKIVLTGTGTCKVTAYKAE